MCTNLSPEGKAFKAIGIAITSAYMLLCIIGIIVGIMLSQTSKSSKTVAFFEIGACFSQIAMAILGLFTFIKTHRLLYVLNAVSLTLCLALSIAMTSAFGAKFSSLTSYIYTSGPDTYSPETIEMVRVLMIVNFAMLFIQFATFIITITGAIMLFETCERRNNIVVYLDAASLGMKLDENETVWTNIESPHTLTISEIERIGLELLKLEKKGDEQNKILEQRKTKDVLEKTEDKDAEIIQVSADQIANNDQGENDGDVGVNQKYQF